jgi:type I restriction enzyme S subunit
MSIGEFIDFNPSESIKKGTVSRKIPMDKLGTFQRKINGSELSEYSSGPKFRNGDTLVAKITPCLENGKTALVDILNDKEVAFGSSEFIVLRENKNSDKNFIYYLSRSPLFRNKAISCMEGTSGRKRVNEGALKTQEILVPDLTTQQKIASVLSALDDKIELNNRINAELEAMAKTLYDYWFVQFDFPNAEEKPYKTSGGKMVYSETLKREIPEGWEVKKLEEIVKKISNSINPNDFQDLKYLPIDKLPKKSFSYSDFEDRENANSSLIKFDKDDILLGAMRVYFHRVCLAYEDGISRNTIFVLRPKHKFLRLFSLFLINKEETIRFANDNSTGSSIPYAKWENGLADYQFCLPAENLIVDFEKQISPIMDKIINNLKQNQELSALRDWLLPMLMNGQVKVGMLD